VPDYAAVDEAVGAIRALRGARVAAFANAVLRKLCAESERLDARQAIVESAPSWLRQELERSVGAEEMRALLGVDGLPPATLRVNPRVSWPDWLRHAEPGRLSPLARRLSGGGDPRQREGFAEGAFVVQEEGAQLIALALGVRSGERVLDACAGRGHKASLLAEQLGSSGELWATDVHPSKLSALLGEFERLRLPKPHVSAVDFSVGPGDVPSSFDRVLVDAPCTGVGTLRRRPEIMARLGPEDPARLGELAGRILRGAAERARPGGRVVYAVCSVLREECEAVLERVNDVLAPAAFDSAEIANLTESDASTLRLLPRRHGTDGYFLASLVRR
jgi:16S rRNA (cytosine967-C5)-methyltransferase